MYRDVHPRERLLHLLALMETAHGHLRRAEELKRQAVDSLKEAKPLIVASSSRPPADSAEIVGYGR